MGAQIAQVNIDAGASFWLLSAMNTPNPQTTKIWTSLFSVSQTLLDAIERELKNNGLPKLSWYDALFEIEKAGAEGIRPYELMEQLLLPQYGTSRLLDRLAKEGLIVRDNVRGDGRGQIIRLTEKGRETRKVMWPVYARTLVKTIEQKLSSSEASDLQRLLGKIANH